MNKDKIKMNFRTLMNHTQVKAGIILVMQHVQHSRWAGCITE